MIIALTTFGIGRVWGGSVFMLLPFQGAGMWGNANPGHCPGLCADWAFSPPHCNGWLRCWARQFGASAACAAYRGRAESPKGRGGSAEKVIGRERAESPKAPSPGQAERHPGYASPASCYAPKGQKHSYGRRGVVLRKCGDALFLCFCPFRAQVRGAMPTQDVALAMSRLGFQPAPLQREAALLVAAIWRIGCIRRV